MPARSVSNSLRIANLAAILPSCLPGVTYSWKGDQGPKQQHQKYSAVHAYTPAVLAMLLGRCLRSKCLRPIGPCSGGSSSINSWKHEALRNLSCLPDHCT